MAKRLPDIVIEQKTSTTHRVAIGLVAISVSLLSLAFGAALVVSPGANVLFLGTNLIAQSVPSTATSVTLSWTAPGDDGLVGQAARYTVRYATTPITTDSFASATAVTNTPTPSPAGTTESLTVNNLQPSTTYFFALTTSDEAGNVSAMSNVATKTTAALPQACIPTYVCSNWSACLNGSTARTCSSANGCPAGLDEPMTTQTCTAATPGIGGGPTQVIQNILVAGLAPGNQPLVRVVNPTTMKTTKQFVAFNPKDRNGVNVAAGDVTGDHQADVIAGTGAGSDPLVKIFSVTGQLKYSFNPYPTESRSGVVVAAGDVNGDGIDEVLTIPAKSSAQLRVWAYDATTKKFKQISQLFVYDRSQRQGYNLAAGDMNNDGRAEIAVTARANAWTVSILQLTQKNTLQQLKRFRAYSMQFTTGLSIAIGDVFGTGQADLIVSAGPKYFSFIKVFDVRGKELKNFYPWAQSIKSGASLTAADVNQDGREELIVGPYQNADPVLRVFHYDGLRQTFKLLRSVLIFPRTIQTGLRLGSI